MVLNNAKNIMLGDTPVDKLYLGDELIWSRSNEIDVTSVLEGFGFQYDSTEKCWYGTLYGQYGRTSRNGSVDMFAGLYDPTKSYAVKYEYMVYTHNAYFGFGVKYTGSSSNVDLSFEKSYNTYSTKISDYTDPAKTIQRFYWCSDIQGPYVKFKYIHLVPREE